MARDMARGECRAGAPPALRSPSDVVRFVCSALGPSYGSRAAVVVIGLDAASRVTGLAENRRRWSPRSLRAPELVDLAAELRARSLVLVQLVPDLRRRPTAREAHAFRALAARCAPDGVHVHDCVVLSGTRWWSLAKLLSERAHSN